MISYSRFLMVISLILGGLATLPAIPEPPYLSDLLANLAPIAIVVLLLICLLATAVRVWNVFITACFGITIAGISMTANSPRYAPWTELTSDDQSLIFFNAERGNQDANRTMRHLVDEKIGTIVFLEATSDWNKLLEFESKKLGAETLYPYKTAELREHFHGILVWSRTPIRDIQYRYYGFSKLPMVSFVLGDGATAPRVFGFHGLAPRTPADFYSRNLMLEDLAKWISEARDTRPVILGGDFNLTPYSFYFREFTTATDLYPVNCGLFGTIGTWPVWLPLMRIQLDHVFVSRQASVTKCTFGPDLASDHLPVTLRFH